ncbi:MAG: hypothetical protein ACAI34_23315, partial [Verrucomicrobium sp.]|nr:hypothetical protein [Verrucomicrobium sp.]
TIMKRDSATGEFSARMVPVNNAPPSAPAVGKWTPATRTFVWTASDERSGNQFVTTAAFPREGIMEWQQVLTTGTGEEAINESGRNIRVKRAQNPPP